MAGLFGLQAGSVQGHSFRGKGPAVATGPASIVGPCGDPCARVDLVAIPADAELSRQDRIAAFRMLEELAKSQEWNLWFTSIDVLDGKEDSVDCYLRGADGGLVLLLGYHCDVNEWRINAYEIRDRTFARPQGESYAQYIARSISESKDGAKSFKDGVEGDGRYFIDYRDGG